MSTEWQHWTFLTCVISDFTPCAHAQSNTLQVRWENW